VTRDIFQLSRFVTLHFPLVENIQPSFCTLGGVLVLVFASQVGKLLFWQCRKSSSAVISLKRSWKMEKLSKSLALNSAIVKYKHKRQQQH